VSKDFGKKFATGSSVTKMPSGGEEIVVQGDVSGEIEEFLLEKYKNIPEDNIELVEDKKKKASAGYSAACGHDMIGWVAAEFQSIGHVIHWSTINRQSPLTPFNAWGDAHRRRFQLHNYILNAPIHVATIPITPDRETEKQTIPNRKPATRSQAVKNYTLSKKSPVKPSSATPSRSSQSWTQPSPLPWAPAPAPSSSSPP
jgi:hypothetical protein